MPSNEFIALKRKEREGEGGKRKERTARGERKNRGKRESLFRDTVLKPRIVSFLFPLALTSGYCSGLRKMDFELVTPIFQPYF